MPKAVVHYRMAVKMPTLLAARAILFTNTKQQYHLKARWLLVFNPHPHFANANPRSGIAREHSK